jgi:hypothetical protein
MMIRPLVFQEKRGLISSTAFRPVSNMNDSMNFAVFVTLASAISPSWAASSILTASLTRGALGLITPGRGNFPRSLLNYMSVVCLLGELDSGLQAAWLTGRVRNMGCEVVSLRLVWESNPLRESLLCPRKRDAVSERLCRCGAPRNGQLGVRARCGGGGGVSVTVSCVFQQRSRKGVPEEVELSRVLRAISV